MTDSGSENVDAEKPDEAQRAPNVLPPSGLGPSAESNRAEGIVGLSFTGHSGPPWSNPDILQGLPPEQRYDLLKSALAEGVRNDENQFQFAKQKLTLQGEMHKRGQWFLWVGLVTILVACVGLSWLFLQFGAKELITPVLTGLGGLGAGFLGGYGYARRSGGNS